MSTKDIDYTQEWSALKAEIKQKIAMTPEEEKKHKERKARELQTMLERAEKALEGNERLFGKKKNGVQKGNWDLQKENADRPYFRYK